jgi:ADP-ribosyl-[dinitrogen reductase] hydrolase
MSAGNGSIMRLAPAVMFFAPDVATVQHFAAESSRTTHGCDEAVDACHLLSAVLLQALAGASKEEVLAVDLLPRRDGRELCSSITSIQGGDYREKTEAEIRGTGYVVESLEAALWCFETTNNFRDAILRATNLGDDADTTAAICGQIAGAYYGEEGIPDSWIEQLALKTEICELADALREAQIVLNGD